MDYIKEHFTVVSMADGLELDALALIPDGNIRGIFQIHHGMEEYKERYLPFMESLAEDGFAAVIHDCRGHGKSVKKPKDLGYMYGVGARGLVEDTRQITQMVKKRWPGLPVILLGHSMGSLVVRMYAKEYDKDIDMLIVCGSPSRNRALWVGKTAAAIEGKILGERYKSHLLEMGSTGIFSGKFKKEGSVYAWCCSDRNVVEEYENSPLCGFNFTIDGYRTLFELMEEVYSTTGWKVDNPSMPVLFMGGGEDPCIGGARKYAQAVQHMRLRGYKNTRGKLYPGMRHEILNEKDKEKVYSDIKKYVKKYFT